MRGALSLSPTPTDPPNPHLCPRGTESGRRRRSWARAGTWPGGGSGRRRQRRLWGSWPRRSPGETHCHPHSSGDPLHPAQKAPSVSPPAGSPLGVACPCRDPPDPGDPSHLGLAALQGGGQDVGGQVGGEEPRGLGVPQSLPAVDLLQPGRPLPVGNGLGWAGISEAVEQRQDLLHPGGACRDRCEGRATERRGARHHGTAHHGTALHGTGTGSTDWHSKAGLSPSRPISTPPVPAAGLAVPCPPSLSPQGHRARAGDSTAAAWGLRGQDLLRARGDQVPASPSPATSQPRRQLQKSPASSPRSQPCPAVSPRCPRVPPSPHPIWGRWR